MIELDGIEYKVQTPAEVTQDLLDYINSYCAENEVKNSQGDVIEISANRTNPLYWLLYGAGYLGSLLQRLLYSAGCAMNIGAASERQLLNLGEIANVKRRQATKTTISCTVYTDAKKVVYKYIDDGAGGQTAVIDEDESFLSLQITRSMSVTLTVLGTTVKFTPAYDLEITAGSAGNIVLVADQYGSFIVSEGMVTQFDTPVDGIRKIDSQASVPGQEQESIASYRARMQRRTDSASGLDRCAEALMALEGVSTASVYFNYNSVDSTTVGDIEVRPRHALLIVQGYNDNIATTFYNYLSCLTSGGSYKNAVEQIYTTRANQKIPVYIIPPERLKVYIQIYVRGSSTDEQRNTIRDGLLQLMSKMQIGSPLTVAAVLDNVAEHAPSITTVYAEIGTAGDNGEVLYGYIVEPNEMQLIEITTDAITFSEM